MGAKRPRDPDPRRRARGRGRAARRLRRGGDKLDIVEGEPVELGELEYNVLFSRFLNPCDVEDAGVPQGQPPPAAELSLLGAFVQVENLGEDRPAAMPARSS